MGISVELFTALKQQELEELVLTCEPFDLGFLSQPIIGLFLPNFIKK